MNDTTTDADPFLIWQLLDSAFPAGSFAHSGGIEAAAALGRIRGEDGVERFARDALGNAASLAAPFVTAACATPERFAELDALHDAQLAQHVANRASRAQGQAWLHAAVACFAAPEVVALQRRVRAERLPCHHAPTWGAVAATLAVPTADAVRLFLFAQARATISAAVRLNLVGPFAGQRLQRRLAPAIAAAAEVGLRTDIADAAAIAPLLDVFHAHHDRLESRLFAT